MFLSELPQSIILMTQENHRERLNEDEFYQYTIEEVNRSVKDLLNFKVSDLENFLDEAIFNFVCLVAENEVAPGVKYYNLYDELGSRDTSLMTFENAKMFLYNHWDESPNEDVSEEEHQEWLDLILAADDEQLGKYLSGIGYGIYELKIA